MRHSLLVFHWQSRAIMFTQKDFKLISVLSGGKHRNRCCFWQEGVLCVFLSKHITSNEWCLSFVSCIIGSVIVHPCTSLPQAMTNKQTRNLSDLWNVSFTCGYCRPLQEFQYWLLKYLLLFTAEYSPVDWQVPLLYLQRNLDFWKLPIKQVLCVNHQSCSVVNVEM